MLENQIKPLSFWYFEQLAKYSNISHFVSTRPDGFSSPPYNSLNLAFHVGDEPQLVLKNRQLLASKLNIPLPNFTTAQQFHSDTVAVIDVQQRGNGATNYETAIPATDAMVTNVPNICLMILTADCVPLLFFDPLRGIIGVAHAGWKGTVKSIARNTVALMQDKFGCISKNIMIGIGPSIGPCCYEVGPDVITQIKKIFSSRTKQYLRYHPTNGKGYLNLWETNKIQLIQSGIPKENIEIARVCTHCHPDTFFSARRQKSNTGRFGTGIMIKTSC